MQKLTSIVRQSLETQGVLATKFRKRQIEPYEFERSSADAHKLTMFQIKETIGNQLFYTIFGEEGDCPETIIDPELAKEVLEHPGFADCLKNLRVSALTPGLIGFRMTVHPIIRDVSAQSPSIGPARYAGAPVTVTSTVSPPASSAAPTKPPAIGIACAAVRVMPTRMRLAPAINPLVGSYSTQPAPGR